MVVVVVTDESDRMVKSSVSALWRDLTEMSWNVCTVFDWTARWFPPDLTNHSH